ncbi:hypothetical protein [Luteipulveratus flavus]|uniref:Uncharacterized protein n=1 Tax=Luteipulveratus flavus TaxID=3031728 RepID=A0ABT6CB71_9MICO|nr:hypothetical protein [Luteipulveratus sp. YIM 133296]MDF8265622.1 hypothetical protein [Luteipulveratus sp. YIM 133296]
MSPSKTTFLSSPLAKNLAAAGAAGAVTLLRPGRFPKWARRSMLAANTAGTGATMLLGAGGTSDPTGAPAPLAGRLGGGGAAAGTTASALAAVTGGLSLVTSGIGLRADAKAEQLLLRRGVKHPRIWMAVGVVGIVLVAGALQDRATRAAEQAAARMQGEDDGSSARGAASTSRTLPTGGATRIGGEG